MTQSSKRGGKGGKGKEKERTEEQEGRGRRGSRRVGTEGRDRRGGGGTEGKDSKMRRVAFARWIVINYQLSTLTACSRNECDFLIGQIVAKFGS